MGFFDDPSQGAGPLGNVIQGWNDWGQYMAQANRDAYAQQQAALHAKPPPPTSLGNVAHDVIDPYTNAANYVMGSLGPLTAPMTGTLKYAHDMAESVGPGLGNAVDVASLGDPAMAPEMLAAHLPSFGSLAAHIGQIPEALAHLTNAPETHFGSLAAAAAGGAAPKLKAAAEAAETAAPAAAAPPPADFAAATPEQFVAARAKSARSGYLTTATADDLANHSLYLAHDNKVGYALDPQGDLQNVFNNDGPRGAGQQALVHAIKNGATTLDAFDGYLPDLYSKYGFVPTGRMKFDPKQAPEKWNFERDGQPDVVFMKYAGGDRGSIGSRARSFPEYNPNAGRYYDDYDSAKADSRAADVGQTVAGTGPAGLPALGEPQGPERGAAALGSLQGGTGVHPADLRGLPDLTPNPTVAQLGGAPPAQSSGLFDLSRLSEAPNVPQFPLQRYDPPRGVSPRVADLVTNQNVRDQMLNVLSQGEQLGGRAWYNTMPFLHEYQSELGNDLGEQGWRRLMDFVAGSSPRSRVADNVRNATYYAMLDRQGLPLPAINPEPYGHLAQKLHRQNFATIQGGGWDLLKNPKPPSFSQNLQGNYLPGTIDAHALKLPAMLSQDPRFLETAFRANEDVPPINVRQMVETGQMPMSEALQRPAYWSAMPKANEYAALENYYRGLGQEMNTPMATAQAQASGWLGGGDITGLGSDPNKPFMSFLEDRINKTAQKLNMDPRDVLRSVIRGKGSLISLPPAVLFGTLGAGALLHQQQQPPPREY
jgi:hypothetical protein